MAEQYFLNVKNGIEFNELEWLQFFILQLLVEKHNGSCLNFGLEYSLLIDFREWVAILMAISWLSDIIQMACNFTSSTRTHLTKHFLPKADKLSLKLVIYYSCTKYHICCHFFLIFFLIWLPETYMTGAYCLLFCLLGAGAWYWNLSLCMIDVV